MSNGNYEIHVKSGKRWTVHSYMPSDAEAIKEARKLLKQRFCEVAKVIVDEKEIFNEDLDSIKKKAGINFIEDSPLTNSLADLYAPSGREMLLNILTEYFDQAVMSPTELLHNNRHIEQLMDDSIFGSALDHLASIQAVKAGENEKERRDMLYELFESAKQRSSGSGYDDISEGAFDNFVNEIDNLEDSKVRFRFDLSLCVLTTRAPSWDAKIVVLRDLVGAEFQAEKLSEKTANILDEILSEWLRFHTAIQEMLGQQPDRYNAMSVLASLCIGNYESKKWDTPATEFVSKLMKKLPMGKTRKALAMRLEQMLLSRNTLTKGDMYDEKHAFKQLFPLFIMKNGTIMGGESMTEALTICGTRSFNRDRTLENPTETINFILEHLGASILQMKFLLRLGNSRFGKDCAEIICNFIPKFMEDQEHVHDIVHYKLPLKKKIKAVTDLQKAALNLQLPNDMNMRLVEWMDDLLFTFLDEERIVDKMDSPDQTLYDRTTKMLQFCASGLLIEGKTLTWVRERVQEHLRQPNFVEKFTEVAPSQKKKELLITQLHSMLKKAGLQE